MQRAEDIPAHIRHIRYIHYNFTTCGKEDFEKKLRNALVNLIDLDE